jgi:hypothetical protein
MAILGDPRMAIEAIEEKDSPSTLKMVHRNHPGYDNYDDMIIVII